MSKRTPDHDEHLVTEALIDRVLTSAHTAGATWDELRAAAAAIDTDGAADPTDGLTWEEVLLPAVALRAEGERPVPADVAERHLAAMHAAVGLATASPGSTWRLAWRRRIAGAAAAATAFTTLGGGAAVAVAQEAAPGDALYGVKLASEQVRLVVETDRAGDARLHLQFAQRRLAELAAAPNAADDLVVAALEHLDEAEENGDSQTVEEAKAVGQGAIDALERLLAGGLPDTASDKARAALERNLERKKAHQEAKESGATGKDQAPGQAKKDGDEAPGNSGNAGRTDGETPDKAKDAPGGRGDAPGQAKKDS